MTGTPVRNIDEIARAINAVAVEPNGADPGNHNPGPFAMGQVRTNAPQRAKIQFPFGSDADRLVDG